MCEFNVLRSDCDAIDGEFAVGFDIADYGDGPNTTTWELCYGAALVEDYPGYRLRCCRI